MLRFGNILNLKGYLFEQAFDKRTIESKIYDLSDTLFYHVVKLLISKDNREASHWVKEVEGYFYKLSFLRFKGKNKQVPYRTYYKWLFVGPFCDAKGFLDLQSLRICYSVLKKDYSDTLNYNLDEKLVKQAIETFYQRFCSSLASDKNAYWVSRFIFELRSDIGL